MSRPITPSMLTNEELVRIVANASRLRFPSQKVRQAQAGPQTIELFPETL
jgi:hypothetical protein